MKRRRPAPVSFGFVLVALVAGLALVWGIRAWNPHHAQPRSARDRGRREHGPVVSRSPALASPSPASTSTPAPTATDTVTAVPTPAPGTVKERRETLARIIEAIAAQSDPPRLVTLGSHGARPRLKRILYHLAQGRDAGADPLALIRAAQRANGSVGSLKAALVEAGLLRNLKLADGLGLLTPDNREHLKRGAALMVTRGPYAGQTAEVDPIVPHALAPELDHELANLELSPMALKRQKNTRAIALSNEVFGNDVRLHGFTERDGETVPVVSQPFIKGREATPEEIADFMDAKGFRPVGMFDWFRDQDGTSVMDAHEGMVSNVTPEQTPRSKMFALAKSYRPEHEGQGAVGGEHTELRRALDNDDLHAAADEIRWLVKQNFVAVESMIRGGSIKAADLPELRRRAKAGAGAK